MTPQIDRRLGRQRQRQRGVSLFVVLVMVLLTTLMTLWAARTALFNEMITGNDSDYQRAMEAAHALVRDAEMDILGQRPDGQPCSTTTGAACRPLNTIDIASKKAYFPSSSDQGIEMGLLTTAIAPSTPSCVAAICVSANIAPEFWRDKSTAAKGLAEMRKVGARYGQYTGAKATDIGNPLLTSPASPTAVATATYWVEPIQYRASGLKGPTQDYAPFGSGASTSATGVVYRITAVAQGQKPSTLAVIQTVFVVKPSIGG